MRRFLVTILFFMMLLGTSCQAKPEDVTGKTETDQAWSGGIESAGAETGELQVHFIDVGQGDSALIICDGHAMLFDTGENDAGVLVQFYLMEQGVDKLDYVIGSHPESDHIGEMDVILLKYDCGQVMLPDVEVDTTTYQDVLKVMEYKNYDNTLPVVGETYQLGSAFFTIIAPNRNDYGDNVNNYSIGIRLVHGDNTFLFTGDAEAEAEEDILSNGISIDADVLQVGHHGSHDSSSQEFIDAVSPEYAVISCGKENDYGHPHEETLDILRAAGAEIFRTDEQGNIVAISDGEDITWELGGVGSWQGVYYVGNKKNGKLHVSTCTSLPKEWNQVIFSTKEEGMNAGFSDFCSRCKP